MRAEAWTWTSGCPTEIPSVPSARMPPHLRLCQRRTGLHQLGEDCAVAQCAERRSRVHIAWDNPVQADEALTRRCNGWRLPELQRVRALWSLALESKVGPPSAGGSPVGWVEYREWWAIPPPSAQMAAVEAMGRLARMSFEEGAFEQSESEHLAWAAGWLSLGAGMKLWWPSVGPGCARPWPPGFLALRLVDPPGRCRLAGPQSRSADAPRPVVGSDPPWRECPRGV